MTGYPTPSAVVLTADGVFYNTGRTHPLSDHTQLDDLATVLGGAARAFNGGEGVVVVDTPMPTLERDGLPDWSFTGIRPWTTFLGPAVVHLGFLPEIKERPGPLLGGFKGPEDIAWRLGRYHTLVGVPWRYTAGVSGCAALRARYSDPRPGRQPLWTHNGPKGMRGAGPLIWRGQTPSEGDDGRVAMFDINSQFLAALRNAKVAWGELEHTGAVAFDHDWPGYWELAVADIPSVLLDGKCRPPVVRAERAHKGGIWVTTPVAKYLIQLLGQVDILDSWVCKNAEPVGRAFAERLSAARLGQLGPMGPAATAVKRTYAELVGMCARPGGSIFRSDWNATWTDLARVNFLRRLDRAAAVEVPGAELIEVRSDAAYFRVAYPTATARLAELLGIGAGPGTFKNPVTLTVADYRKSIRGAK